MTKKGRGQEDRSGVVVFKRGHRSEAVKAEGHCDRCGKAVPIRNIRHFNKWPDGVAYCTKCVRILKRQGVL